MENVDFAKFQEQTAHWLVTNVLNGDAVIQGGIIILSFALSLVLHRPLRARLNDRINNLRIPFRLTEVLRSLTKLIFPAIALILMLLMMKVAGPTGFGFKMSFAVAVSKLISAWILIRLLLQFIENRFARNVIAFTILTIAALSIFGILEETTTALDSLGVNLGSFRLSALTVTKGALSLFILMYGALFLSKFFERRLAQAASLTPSSRVLIGKIVRVFLVTAALLVGLTTAGIDLSLLAVFSGAVGLGVGFGLQRGISNLFSGMMLLLDQSIKPGDIIEMPSTDGKTATFGWVQYMGSRYTEIVTRDNKSFLVPNEQLITQQVVNWSHGDTLVRLETRFGVHYDSNPHDVKKLAEEAASKPERVVKVPSPVCHFIEFGESSLNFSLRFWIKDAEKGITNVRGEVMLALWDTFRENGIKIPYPHREIFMHDPARAKK